MNLVDLVKDQLTSQVLGSLGSLVGADESQTRSATSAAVPALLGGLAKLASSQAGASQIASALGGLDLGALGNLAGVLGGSNASRMADQGGSLLSSLFGTTATGKMVDTLAGFLGMKPGIARSLLAYLAPIVLGMVAKQFTGGRADAAGLQRLFADQAGNIKNALPAGLSLGDFGVSGGVTTPAAGHKPAGSGLPAWVPLVLLPLLAIGAWYFMNQAKMANQEDGGVMIEEIRKEGPLTIDRTEVIEREGQKLIDAVSETISIDPKFVEAARLTVNATELFGNLATVLGGVTNEDEAKAAIPKLEQLGPMLTGVQSEAEKLEGENKAAFADFISKNLDRLQKVIDIVMAIPGVKDLLGPVVGPMIDTIKKLGQ